MPIFDKIFDTMLASVIGIATIFSGFLVQTPVSVNLQQNVATTTQATQEKTQTGTTTNQTVTSTNLSSTSPKTATATSTQKVAVQISQTSSQLANIVAQLRNSKWSNTKRTPPRTACVGPSDGIGFEARLADGDDDYNYDDINFLITTDDGGQAGSIPLTYNGITGTMFASQAGGWDAEKYGAVFVISSYDPGNATLRIRNASSTMPHYFSLDVTDANNNCSYAEGILLGFPDSKTTAYVPLTAKGDVGPIAWDLDNDGVMDYYESLVYEPSDTQFSLLFEREYILRPKETLALCKEALAAPAEDQFPSFVALRSFCKTKV